MAGYLVSSLSKLLIALSSSVSALIMARSGERIGKGIRIAPRDSFIGETIPEAYIGKAFGIHKMMDSVGAATGTLAALLMWQAGFGVRTIITAGAAVAFTALIPILLLNEKSKGQPRTQRPPAKKKLNAVMLYTGIFNYPLFTFSRYAFAYSVIYLA